MLNEEGMGKDGLRRESVNLLGRIKTRFAAEVRDVALGGNARSAKEYDSAAFVYDFLQSLIHFRSSFLFISFSLVCAFFLRLFRNNNNAIL